MTTDTSGHPTQSPAASPPSRPQGSADLDHLRLLSIFHYVLAALVALMSFLPVFQLVIMGLVLSDREFQEEPAARVAFGLTMAVLVAMILAGLAFAVCLALAGRYLAGRTHYNFCLVMAAISCILVPLGTALGIFTLLVLTRPTVKERFSPAPAS